MTTCNRTAVFALAAAATFALAAPASAESHHRRHSPASGVSYAHVGRTNQQGGQALVSDGPGTGFGFHRLPGGYRVAAAAARGLHRDRQAEAVRSAVVDDAVESYGPFGDGLAGEGGLGHGGYGTGRGVFSYPDGYGSPYFAGYYGPGDGADYGPFGQAYTN